MSSLVYLHLSIYVSFFQSHDICYELCTPFEILEILAFCYIMYVGMSILMYTTHQHPLENSVSIFSK